MPGSAPGDLWPANAPSDQVVLEPMIRAPQGAAWRPAAYGCRRAAYGCRLTAGGLPAAVGSVGTAATEYLLLR